MNNVLRCAAVLVMISTLTACSGSGGLNWFGSKKSELAIDTINAREIGYRTSWVNTQPRQRKQKLENVQLLGDVIVALRTPSNVAYAVSTRNGEMLWYRAVGTAYEKLYGPVRTDGNILINSATRLYQLDANDGSMVYVTNLQYPVSTAPAIGDDLVWFGSTSGMLYAQNLSSGILIHQYQLPGEIQVAPVISGIGVFAADMTGVYKMLDRTSGNLAWDGRSFAPITGQPAASVAIYVPSHDQTLYALDRNTGSDRWKFRSRKALPQGPVAIGRYVFQPLGEGGLVALDASTGEERWRTEEDAKPVLINGDRLLMFTQNSLRWVELSSGTVLTQVPTAKLRDVFATPENALILVTENGNLQRIDPI